MDHKYFTSDYLKMFEAALEAVTDEQLRELGVTRKKVFNIRNAGSISLEAIEDVVATINQATPQAALPPPMVKISSREEFEWYALGRRLLYASPTRFRAMLRRLERVVEGVEAEGELDLSVNPDEDD